MARRRRQRAGLPVATPRVKVWLEIDGAYAFGFGISEILKAVDRAGSIKAGAARLGKSYRHIWGRIKKTEQVLGETLVQAQVGGAGTHRSRLTEFAQRWIADYDALRARMFQVVEEEFADRFEHGRRPGVTEKTGRRGRRTTTTHPRA